MPDRWFINKDMEWNDEHRHWLWGHFSCHAPHEADEWFSVSTGTARHSKTLRPLYLNGQIWETIFYGIRQFQSKYEPAVGFSDTPTHSLCFLWRVVQWRAIVPCWSPCRYTSFSLTDDNVTWRTQSHIVAWTSFEPTVSVHLHQQCTGYFKCILKYRLMGDINWKKKQFPFRKKPSQHVWAHTRNTNR